MLGHTCIALTPQWSKITCFPTARPPGVASGSTSHPATERVAHVPWYGHCLSIHRMSQAMLEISTVAGISSCDCYTGGLRIVDSSKT
ncbi:hypothetical protein TNCV_1517971 [Trichonephila clavipes]|nr:hypothetical protein TNCV_1517971 [Trichonephila clavipes]